MLAPELLAEHGIRSDGVDPPWLGYEADPLAWVPRPGELSAAMGVAVSRERWAQAALLARGACHSRLLLRPSPDTLGHGLDVVTPAGVRKTDIRAVLHLLGLRPEWCGPQGQLDLFARPHAGQHLRVVLPSAAARDATALALQQLLFELPLQSAPPPEPSLERARTMALSCVLGGAIRWTRVARAEDGGWPLEVGVVPWKAAALMEALPVAASRQHADTDALRLLFRRREDRNQARRWIRRVASQGA